MCLICFTLFFLQVFNLCRSSALDSALAFRSSMPFSATDIPFACCVSAAAACVCTCAACASLSDSSRLDSNVILRACICCSCRCFMAWHLNKWKNRATVCLLSNSSTCSLSTRTSSRCATSWSFACMPSLTTRASSNPLVYNFRVSCPSSSAKVSSRVCCEARSCACRRPIRARSCTAWFLAAMSVNSAVMCSRICLIFSANPWARSC
mmetsp:Transcript_81084/g.206116  ORF Transcript_81084/g.206116 Transcript_81084/m.206116 type:complete len:208 (-) Transcript_81084:356-979(-)